MTDPHFNGRARGSTAPTRIPSLVTQGDGSSGANNSLGALRVRNTEFWGVLKVQDQAAITSLQFTPGRSGMTALDDVGGMYGAYRVNSARVTITGTAPITSKSVAHLYLEYEPTDVANTLGGVLSTSPNVTVFGFRNGALAANKQALQRVTWIDSNETAFLLAAWLQGDKDDEWLVYCEYDAEFRKPIERRSSHFFP